MIVCASHAPHNNAIPAVAIPPFGKHCSAALQLAVLCISNYCSANVGLYDEALDDVARNTPRNVRKNLMELLECTVMFFHKRYITVHPLKRSSTRRLSAHQVNPLSCSSSSRLQLQAAGSAAAPGITRTARLSSGGGNRVNPLSCTSTNSPV